jgi:hypothetical protein
MIIWWAVPTEPPILSQIYGWGIKEVVPPTRFPFSEYNEQELRNYYGIYGFHIMIFWLTASWYLVGVICEARIIHPLPPPNQNTSHARHLITELIYTEVALEPQEAEPKLSRMVRTCCSGERFRVVLKTKATNFCETLSLTNQTTRCHLPEHHNLNRHCSQTPKISWCDAVRMCHGDSLVCIQWFRWS